MSVSSVFRRVSVGVFCLWVAAAAAQSQRGPQPPRGPSPRVVELGEGIRMQVGPDWTSPKVAPERIFIDPRNRPPVPRWQPGDPVREIPRLYHGDPRIVGRPRPPVNPVIPGLDPLAELQREIGPTRGASGFTIPLVNQPGNANTGVSPSDVNGDVGTTHYLQSINGGAGAVYTIFDKTTGLPVAGPFDMANLGTGGNCASGLGDPIVLFDELANRWMISEFTSGSNDLCIYISQFADPSLPQTWSRYAFTPANSFPDYPHYGVMPDAYYLGTNQGNSTRPVCALERAPMLAGTPARMSCFFPTALSGFGFQILQPADHDGADAPPAGAPGIFMRHRDDEVHNSGSNNPTGDFLEYFRFTTNWVDTAQATLTGPFSIQIAEIDSDLNGLSAFEAFPQPNGQRLDPLRELVMFRLAYRNFGSHETLVGTMVTDVDGNDTGGLRWFELRRTGGIASPWTLFQEGTYAPADAGGPIDRWMGAIAMDESGNLALGYSAVRQSPAVFPGLRYVGRLAGDTPGVMTTNETTLAVGDGSQTNERWGDYFSMSVDPSDGCTFWFTGQYVPVGDANDEGPWETRIGAFRHDTCGTPTFTLSGAPLTQGVCAVGPSTPLPPVAITVGSRNGFNNPVAMSFGSGLPAGFSGSYTSTPVTPPGNTAANLAVDGGVVAPGRSFVTLRGTSGMESKDLSLAVDVATIPATTPAPVAPADGAINQVYLPTLSWSAVAQAASYVVEVSTTANFAAIAYTATVSGTSHVVATPLAAGTQFFWRVRAVNACATSANSVVRSFTTLPSPDQCPVGTTAQQAFFDNIENGLNGWVATPASGNATRRWTQSTVRPFSPTRSWKSGYPENGNQVSDQTLDSPAVALPAGAAAITLQFRHYRDIEENGPSACYDGGRLEISLNNGAFTPIPANQILVDPYYGQVDSSAGNPLGGEAAWCGLIDYSRPVVDLTPYAGNSVRVRYRFATDDSVFFDGWFVDDVLFQTCTQPTTLTSAPDPSVFGQAVTLTATVVGNTPTGNVQFFDGATPLGTSALNGSGVATLSVSTLTAGPHALTANYAGDANDPPSSDDDTQLVNKASTTLSIADSPDPSNSGQTVTITRTLNVTLPGAGTPTGTITVTGTNTTGCSIVLPATTCPLTFTAAGPQTIDATYSGDANFNGSSAPQITHASNANPTVVAPASQTILEGAATGVLAVTVGDAETAATSLLLTASSNNTTLVPNANIALGGSGTARTVQVTPVVDGFGTATITLTVTDGSGATATATFDVVVTGVNDAPSFTVLGNRTHPAGTSGAQTVPAFVTGTNFGPGESGQAVLSYAVVQSGGTAGVASAVAIANDGTLTYTLSGAGGTATFSATLRDNGGVADGGVDTSSPVAFSITVADGADLSVTKSNALVSVVAGTTTTYTVDVSNDGPAGVTGARVLDTIPAGLSGATWTCATVAIATCPVASGSGTIDQLVDLASGARLRYTLTATVSGSVGSSVVNTASVQSATSDPNPGNESSTDTDPVVPDMVFDNGFESP